MQVLLLAGRTLRDLRGAEFNSLRNRPVGFHATYLSPLSTHSERWESSGKEDDEGGGGGGREEEEEKTTTGFCVRKAALKRKGEKSPHPQRTEKNISCRDPDCSLKTVAGL